MVSNLVHIHSGQCGDSLGGVAYGLSNFVDGLSVTLVEGVSLDSILTGDFAVNAHNADDPQHLHRLRQHPRQRVHRH
jgi:hypothetical protein